MSSKDLPFLQVRKFISVLTHVQYNENDIALDNKWIEAIVEKPDAHPVTIVFFIL